MKKKLNFIILFIMLFILTACGGSTLSGTYTDSTEMMGSISFGKNNTFEMSGGLGVLLSSNEEGIWCRGTYSFGDDKKTLYLKSDESSDSKVEAFGATWTYDKSADVIVLEGDGERYVFYKRTDKEKANLENDDKSANETVDSANNQAKEENEANQDFVKEPTIDDVIEMAKNHATWIDKWFKEYPDITDCGWECNGPIDEAYTDYIQTYKNNAPEMIEIEIPAGSFTGGRGAAGGTSGWYIYSFAYIKTQDGYKLVDLYCENEADAYFENIENDAYSKCNKILEMVLNNKSEVSYLSTDGEECIDFNFIEFGTRYRFLYNDGFDELHIFPKLGNAYRVSWDNDSNQEVSTPLMINNVLVETN